MLKANSQVLEQRANTVIVRVLAQSNTWCYHSNSCPYHRNPDLTLDFNPCSADAARSSGALAAFELICHLRPEAAEGRACRSRDDQGGMESGRVGLSQAHGRPEVIITAWLVLMATRTV